LRDELGYDVYDHLDAERQGNAYRGLAKRPSRLLPSRLGEGSPVATQGTRRIWEKYSIVRARCESAPHGVARARRHGTLFARHEPNIKASGRGDSMHGCQLE
jgi:hypothetical protein